MASLTAFINLVDKFSPNMKKMTSSSDVFTNSLNKLAKVAAGAFGIAAVTNFAKESFNAFTQLEEGMNKIFTLLPDISQKGMDEMTAQVKDFSKNFGVELNQATDGMYEALSAGIKQEDVFNFLETAQRMAVGGVSELGTAVDGLSSVVNAYGMETISVKKASDLMFTAAAVGKTDIQQLSQSLYNVIPTAASLGVTFEDVSAAIGSITAVGVPTSVATTQLRQLFVELSKEGTNTSKVFKQISGKSFKQFVASGKNTQDALKLLESHAKKTGVGINDLFGSVEAGNAALSLTGKGTQFFTDALDAANNSAGATEAAYDRMNKGIGRSIEKIKANFEVFKADLGSKFLPVIANVSDFVVKTMPEVQKSIESVITFLSPKLSEIGQLIKEIGTTYFGDLNVASGNLKNSLTDLVTSGFDILKGSLEWIRDNSDTVKGMVIALTAAYIAQKGILLSLAVAHGVKTASQWASIAADKAETIAIVALYAKDYVLAGAMKVVTAAQWLMNAAMNANPIMWVVLAIGALIIAGIALYKNWDTVTKFTEILMNKFNDLKDKALVVIKNEFEYVKKKVEEFYDSLVNLKDKALQWAIEKFTDFKKIIEDNKTAIEVTAAILGTIFGPALLVTGIKAGIAGAQIASSFIANVVKAGAEAIVAGSKLTISFIGSMIKAGTEAVISGTKLTVSFISSMIKTGAEAVVNGTKLTISFIGSIIKAGAEAVIAGGKIVVSFIGSLIKTAAQAVITGTTITVNLISSIISYAIEGWKAVASITAQTAAWIAQGIQIAVVTAAQIAHNVAVGAWNIICGIATGVTTAFGVALAFLTSPIGLVILAIAALVAIGVLLYKNWDLVKAKASELGSAVANKFNSIKESASQVVQGIKEKFSNGLEAVKGFFNNFKPKFPHIPMPHFSVSGSMNPLKWIDQGIPKIAVQWYAKGTDNAKKGPAVVGEKGPELMWMNGGEKVLPNGPTMDLLNSTPTMDHDKAESIRSSGFSSTVEHNEKTIAIDKLFGDVTINTVEDLKALIDKLSAYLEEELFNSGGTVYET